MRILTNGNVGIGTTAPQAALHVAGSFDANSPTGNGVLMGFYSGTHGYMQLNGPSGGYIDFSTSGTDHKGRILYDNTGNYLRLDTNGSEKLRINSAGNVGIGTSIGINKLDVAGNINVMGGNGSYLTFNNGDANIVINNNGTGRDLSFKTYDGSSNAERMRIDKNGNVGIGTTSPTEKLEVKSGSIFVNGEDNGIIVDSVSKRVGLMKYAGHEGVIARASTNDFGIVRCHTADIFDGSSLTYDFYVSGTGNVGIGTTGPRGKLDIVGNTDNDADFLTIQDNDTSAGSHRPSIRFRSDTAQIGQIVALDNSMRFSVGTTETSLLEIASSGNVGIGTTGPVVKLQVNGTNASVGTIGTPKSDWYTTAYNGIQIADGTTIWGRAGDSHFSGNYYVKNNSGSAQDTYINALSAHDLWLDNSSGSLKYRNAGSGGAGNAISFNTRFVVLNNGNFGIGTTSPIDKLNVNGGTGDATTQQPKITVTRTSSTGNVLAGKMILTTKPSDPTNHGNLVFQVKTTASAGESSAYYTNAITIDGKNAKVGIGTASPDKDLTVGGVNPTHGINLRTKSGSSEWLLWQVEQYFSQEGYMRMFNDNVAKIQFRANGGSYFVGGNVGIGTTSPDSKLEVITSGTNTVLELDNSDSNYTVIQYNASGATKGFSGFNSGFMLFGGEAGTTTRLQSGGSYAATILENGNIGIGTTSPTSPLTIKSNSTSSSSSGLTIQSNGNTNNIFELAEKSTDGARLQMYDAGVAKIALYTDGTNNYINAGNVGIGTTSPATKFVVSDAGGTGLEITPEDANTRISLVAYDRLDFAYRELNFDGYNYSFRTSGNVKAVMLNTGNVGIGTTSPGEKLEVAGNIQASGAIFQGTTSSTIALKTSGATLRANIIGNNNGLELGVFGTKSINFEWDAVTKIQMKSTGEGIFAGKVSINNASSRDSILNIVDDGTNGNIAFENDSGDVVGIITSVVDELNIRVGDGISMSDSIRLRLTESGNLVIAGTLTQNSDVRLKENIKPIESALDKVKQMQGVEFNKINSSTKEIGVVAQEIEKIIPELVLEDKEGIKSVAYGNITAVLIEAIKEQQKQIEELKQQLNK
jgi:hypothetical protein